jgi:hypothetical protein
MLFHDCLWLSVGVGRKRTLRAEELSRDVERLATDDHNLLAVQKLLGDNGGQSTEKVTLAVDDDLEKDRDVSRMISLFGTVARMKGIVVERGRDVQLARKSTCCRLVKRDAKVEGIWRE